MSRAVAESLFQLLKRERICRCAYPSRAAARQDMFEYIRMFYNPKCKHTNNRILSPVDFEIGQQNLTNVRAQETRSTSSAEQSRLPISQAFGMRCRNTRTGHNGLSVQAKLPKFPDTIIRLGRTKTPGLPVASRLRLPDWKVPAGAVCWSARSRSQDHLGTGLAVGASIRKQRDCLDRPDSAWHCGCAESVPAGDFHPPHDLIAVYAVFEDREDQNFIMSGFGAGEGYCRFNAVGCRDHGVEECGVKMGPGDQDRLVTLRGTQQVNAMIRLARAKSGCKPMA